MFIKNVDLYLLSLHFESYIGQINTSDNVLGHFPFENFSGISKVSLLFIQAVKEAGNSQKMK